MKNRHRSIFYIELIIEGEQIKRFINMCRKDDITFIHIQYDREHKDRIIVRMSRNDVLKMKKNIRATHSHIKIIRKNYPRYYIFRYRGHYSFLAGIIIMFICLKVLGMFVWQVDFSGNHMYTDETLRRYMQDKGVTNASLISAIDCDALEEMIRNDFDVTWACVAVKGSRVIVYIKENYSSAEKNNEAVMQDKNRNSDIINNVKYYVDSINSANQNDNQGENNQPEQADIKGKCIYSQYDGDVYSIITREGTPVVHIGDSVTAGQLLVDGTVAITDDSGTVIGASKVDSDADIKIKTVIPYEDYIEVSCEDKIFTGKKRYRLILESDYGVVKLGLSSGDDELYDTTVIRHKLYAPGYIDTGVIYGYEVQSEYETFIRERDEEECNGILKQRLDTYIKHIEQKGVQIMECRVNIEASGSYYRCSGELEVLTDPETDIR